MRRCICSMCLRVAIGLVPNTTFLRLLGTKSNKSSVDDFDMEQGIVRARVGLSYDPLRLSPCSGDLYANARKLRALTASPLKHHKQNTWSTNQQHNKRKPKTRNLVLTHHSDRQFISMISLVELRWLSPWQVAASFSVWDLLFYVTLTQFINNLSDRRV